MESSSKSRKLPQKPKTKSKSSSLKSKTSSNTSSNIFYPAYTYYTITTIYNHHSTPPYHLQLLSITQHRYLPIISCILTTTLQSKHNTNTHRLTHHTIPTIIHRIHILHSNSSNTTTLVVIPPLIPLQDGGTK